MMRSQVARLPWRGLSAFAASSRVARPAAAVTCQATRRAARLQPLTTSAFRSAEATTAHSTFHDPAVEEAQRQLELGTASLEAGDVTSAKAAYERSIEVKETASARFNLGVCLYHEQNVEGAIEAWKRTLELSPDAADAHTNLASAYVMASPTRPDLAVDHLKQAAAITPGDAEIQFNLGAVLEACEQLEEATKAYERARDGGIERAQDNVRNCKAKILAVKMGLVGEPVADGQTGQAKE